MSLRTCTLLLGAMALAGCRQEVVTVPTGFRGEALTNPLLGAQRTMERLGTTSTVQYGLSTLPTDGEVLLTAEGTLAIEGPILERFLDWVDTGGTAVVCLDGFALPTGIFGVLGIEADEDFFFEDETPEPWIGRRSALLDALELERIESDEYWIDFLGFDVASRAKDGWLSDGESEEGAFEIDRGQGSITVIPSGHFFNNMNLGDEQHAELLYALVAQGGEGGQFVIAYVETPGLWGLLTARAPFALWSGLALLILWLWRSWPRFGPIENLESIGQAGFRTHVSAVGRFLWKHDRGPSLLRSARKRTLNDIRSRIPGAENMDREDLCRILAEQTGLELGEVERALFPSGPMRPDAFLAAQQALTQLRAQS